MHKSEDLSVLCDVVIIKEYERMVNDINYNESILNTGVDDSNMAIHDLLVKLKKSRDALISQIEHRKLPVNL